MRFSESGFTRKLLNYLLIIVVFLFMAAGAVHTLDSQISGAFSEADGDLAFHDCLYYILVSFSTVGYGDIFPTAWSTRFCLCLCLSVYEPAVARAAVIKVNKYAQQCSVLTRAYKQCL